MTDDDLIALAKKATPGPWEATDGVVWIDTREQVCCGRSYTECCGQYDIKGGQEKIADSGETDAAYIAAANPAAIIALIERHSAEVDELQERVGFVEGKVDITDMPNHYAWAVNELTARRAYSKSECATLIAEQRAEVERLTRERDEARQWNRLYDRQPNETQKKAIALRAANWEIGCACQFDENDEQIVWCSAHVELRQRATAAEAALAAAQKRVGQLQGTVAFFASVIKSGEPWTQTCEDALRAALKESGNG